MSDSMRNVLATVMMVVLALSAFAAGYFTNDFVEQRFADSDLEGNQDFALFWEAWGLIERNFLGDLPNSQELAYGAIRGAMQVLNDPYTIFIEPVAREHERDILQGSFGGIGATLSRPEEGGPVILEPIPGNPAELAGIQIGDELVAVDGTPIPLDMTVQAVADMIRGEKGTTVMLTVLHPGAVEPQEIEIERGDILIPSVTYRLLSEDEAIGYIQLTRFSGESSNEVAEALTDLLDQGAEKLVLDLRGNGGGLLDAAVDIADHFVDEGPVMYQQQRGEDERVYNATDETLAGEVPLVILIDGGTASAAEIVAGALHDRERAVLVGSSGSFGKGSVQLVYDLSDGSSVHITSSRWFTPNRIPLDQEGIQPDILVTVTQEDIDNGRDAILNQAITHLQNEK
ncbi:MAG: S41 family peptidase [Chloroflexi bacterium]|nr:MAG: S41 family peptidase [Chloroflexota bacterium]